MSGRLQACTVPVASLTAADVEGMWALYEANYAGVSRERFVGDLLAKDHVFVLRDGGDLRGFSTVVREHRTLASGRRAVVVFSGDTVIERAYRGQSALQWAFFLYIARTKLQWPGRLVVWFLISKGYKTWLLLARNFPCHWPRRDVATPTWARALIDDLATDRFGPAYEPARGVLRADGTRLKPEVAPVDAVDDPDVAFFVRANPGHADGDELCCIGVVDARLVATWPWRVTRRHARRRASRSTDPG
jgi:hypothetical protein